MKFNQASIDRHRAAYNQAKAEAVCSCEWRDSVSSHHHSTCQQNISQLLRRAEEIRQRMEDECRTASTS